MFWALNSDLHSIGTTAPSALHSTWAEERALRPISDSSLYAYAVTPWLQGSPLQQFSAALEWHRLRLCRGRIIDAKGKVQVGGQVKFLLVHVLPESSCQSTHSLVG